MLTDSGTYDYFLGTYPHKSLYTSHFSRFLESHQPEVVHFQHTMHIGYDLVTLTRRTLPDAAIVYTLHEYWPICNRAGQMVRSFTEAAMHSRISRPL